MRQAKVIVINVKDNVATALDGLEKGATVSVELKGGVEDIQLVSDVPKGHKLALRPIKKGEAVIKYGETIGRAVSKVARGEHVHVHNLVSGPKGGAR